MKPQGVSAWASVALIGGLLGLVGLAALAIGSVNVPFERTIAILLHQLHLTEEVTWTPMQATIILQVRFPRVLMAALVGGGLALSGAVMQGIFQNPMADPGTPGGVQRGSPGGCVGADPGVGYATLPHTARLRLSGRAGGGRLGLRFGHLGRQDSGRDPVTERCGGELAECLLDLIYSYPITGQHDP